MIVGVNVTLDTASISDWDVTSRIKEKKKKEEKIQCIDSVLNDDGKLY